MCKNHQLQIQKLKTHILALAFEIRRHHPRDQSRPIIHAALAVTLPELNKELLLTVTKRLHFIRHPSSFLYYSCSQISYTRMESKTLVRLYRDVIQSRPAHQSVRSHAYISVDLTNEKGVAAMLCG